MTTEFHPLTPPSSAFDWLRVFARPELSMAPQPAERQASPDRATLPLTAEAYAEVPWPDVVRAARRHRVLPLLYVALKTHAREAVPGPVLKALRSSFVKRYHYVHRLQAELDRVRTVLREAGIPSVAFKGPVLAAMAYQDLKLRPFSDLDVMIPVEAVPDATAALAEEGWQAAHPLQPDYGAWWRTYYPWHRPHGNANGYVRRTEHGAYALALDLHWGLASRYFQLGFDPSDWWSRTQEVALPDGSTVTTFSDEDTFIFLCMHGTKHEWDRLSYVCDLAAFLTSHPAMDWDTVLERAAALRLRRMVLVGLWLAQHLLGAPQQPAAEAALAADPRVERLGRQVVRFLQADKVERSEAFRFHLDIRDRRRDALGTLWYNTTLALGSASTAPSAKQEAGTLGMWSFVRPAARLVHHWLAPRPAPAPAP